jgi:hypothetical protein
MATRERPRAMVLVNACWRTPRAFSQGELVWAKTGRARTSTRSAKLAMRRTGIVKRKVFVRVFMRDLGERDALRKAMRGKPASPLVHRAAAGTHWSKDTLGDSACPLRLDATGRQERDERANFPLSTYSVFRKKNVSRKNEEILAELKNRLPCPDRRTIGTRQGTSFG